MFIEHLPWTGFGQSQKEENESDTNSSLQELTV